MDPPRLAWLLLWLHTGGTAALALPNRDVVDPAPSALRLSSHALRRLLGHKRAPQVSWASPGGPEDHNWKRAPNGLGASGFYGDVFNQGFGAFSPVKRDHQASKRRPETVDNEIDGAGEVFDEESKNFDKIKRRPEMSSSGFYDDVFRGDMGHFEPMKRRPEMSSSGFYDDVFRGDMGHFEPMKRRPEMSSSGFYDDVFRGDMGHFEPMKRRPEMSASGFYDNVFRGDMGHFEPMKRMPEMSSSGFYDDVFRGDMGHFEPMKRRLEMSSSGLHDDLFRGDIGHFEPMKRRPEMSASGFYDDVFRGDMGHFQPMKRRPEMSASGFYDHIFRGHMGHFEPVKRRSGKSSGFYNTMIREGMGHSNTMNHILESERQIKSSGHSHILTHPQLSSEQSTRTEANDSRIKRNSDDEVLSAKGFRSDSLSEPAEMFSMMR